MTSTSERADLTTTDVEGSADSALRRLERFEPVGAAQKPARRRNRSGDGTDRVSRWDRPKPPKDWRWFVGGTGRILITLGLLMFGFVAYQLWGTGIQTAAAQNKLEDQWQQQLAAYEAPTVPSSTVDSLPVEPEPTDSVPDDSVPTTSEAPAAIAPPPEPNPGELLGGISIPSIDANWWVVSGVTTDDLKDGPGHFRESVLPGQLGNSAIAGHRTTHGAPFGRIDELEPGDEIIIQTLAGRFVYRVTDTIIVDPSEYGLVVPTVDPGKATLALVSCHPEYTSRQRIIVRAEMVVEVSTGVVVPNERPLPQDDPDLPDEEPAEDSLPSQGGVDDPSDPATPASASSGDDIFSGGWFDDPKAPPQVALWGAIVAAIAIGSYLLSKWARRYWVGLSVAAVPFVVALYFFYENVNRLLPPGL